MLHNIKKIIRYLVFVLPILLITGCLIYIQTSYVGVDNVYITNIKDTSATIVWTTTKPTVGSILVSSSSGMSKASEYFDDRDIDEVESGVYEIKPTGLIRGMTHHVTIRDLSPSSTYFFQIKNGEITKNDFENNTFATTPVPDQIFEPDPVYGLIGDREGNPLSDGVVIFEREGMNGNSQLLSTTFGYNGSYAFDIQGLYDEKFERLYIGTDEDKENLTFLGVVNNDIEKQTKIAYTEMDKPVKQVSLGEDNYAISAFLLKAFAKMIPDDEILFEEEDPYITPTTRPVPEGVTNSVHNGTVELEQESHEYRLYLPLVNRNSSSTSLPSNDPGANSPYESGEQNVPEGVIENCTYSGTRCAKSSNSIVIYYCNKDGKEILAGHCGHYTEKGCRDIPEGDVQCSECYYLTRIPGNNTFTSVFDTCKDTADGVYDFKGGNEEETETNHNICDFEGTKCGDDVDNNPLTFPNMIYTCDEDGSIKYYSDKCVGPGGCLTKQLGDNSYEAVCTEEFQEYECTFEGTKCGQDLGDQYNNNYWYECVDGVIINSDWMCQSNGPESIIGIDNPWQQGSCITVNYGNNEYKAVCEEDLPEEFDPNADECIESSQKCDINSTYSTCLNGKWVLNGQCSGQTPICNVIDSGKDVKCVSGNREGLARDNKRAKDKTSSNGSASLSNSSENTSVEVEKIECVDGSWMIVNRGLKIKECPEMHTAESTTGQNKQGSDSADTQVQKSDTDFSKNIDDSNPSSDTEAVIVPVSDPIKKNTGEENEPEDTTPTPTPTELVTTCFPPFKEVNGECVLADTEGKEPDEVNENRQSYSCDLENAETLGAADYVCNDDGSIGYCEYVSEGNYEYKTYYCPEGLWCGLDANTKGDLSSKYNLDQTNKGTCQSCNPPYKVIEGFCILEDKEKREQKTCSVSDSDGFNAGNLGGADYLCSKDLGSYGYCDFGDGSAKFITAQCSNNKCKYSNTDANGNYINDFENIYTDPCSGDPIGGQGSVLSKLFTPISAQETDINEVRNDLENGFVSSGYYEVIVDDTAQKSFEVYEQTYVLFFYDTNENNEFDDGEKLLDDQEIEDLKIKVSKVSDVMEYKFKPGWNLVSFPFVMKGEGTSDISTAANLISEINMQGGEVTQVVTYRSGRFLVFSQRFSTATNEYVDFGQDFNIIPGEGYFVRSYISSDLQLKVRAIEGGLSVLINPGWNLVGIYHNNQSFRGFELIKDMIDAGIQTEILSKWQDGQYFNLVLKNGTEYGNDYDVHPNKGYWVQSVAENPGVYTPE